TTARHSISTRAPKARPVTPKALRAGIRSGLKKVRYTSFISPHSFMSASMTVHFTTWSIDDPYASRALRMFSNVCLVSDLIPPVTSLPELSVPSFPDSINKSPTRTASENGMVDPALRFKYSIIVLSPDFAWVSNPAAGASVCFCCAAMPVANVKQTQMPKITNEISLMVVSRGLRLTRKEIFSPHLQYTRAPRRESLRFRNLIGHFLRHLNHFLPAGIVGAHLGGEIVAELAQFVAE